MLAPTLSPSPRRATVVSTKAEREAAYRAGSKALAISWPDTSELPEEQKVPGPHLNPFGDDRPEERQAWLEGLRDGLEGRVAYDPATIVKEINDELKVASDAR
jgi:hypothetical protein